ncbi:ABC1 kinase family protein [Nocardia sp. NPDC020380]|uniref:ABC1 kinase family protein n=1 Tax=Nocardia sp. NPDC020380 TaxID=3364309 RepID=UPI00378C4D54
MTIVASLVVFVTAAAAVAVLAAVARRVIGSPVGWPRTILLAIAFPTVGSAAANALVRYLGTLGPDRRVTDFAGTAVLVLLVWAWIFVLLPAALYVAEILVPTGSIPGPVTAIRRLENSRRETLRYLQLLTVLVRHGLGGFLRRGAEARAGDVPGAARRLRAALQDAGVTYIKLGQMLSARRDIVPASVADELAELQSDVAPMPWAEAEAVLRHSLGGPLDTVFAEMDREPLAAASVGQVHSALLLDGSAVVVKVQRPEARTQVDRDLRIMRRIARRLQRDARWARNLAAVMADSPIIIPAAYPRFSSSTVLVMQRVSGIPIGSAATRLAGLDRETRVGAAHLLLEEVLRQILAAGVFHADLHPGNVLIDADGTLAMLDFGAVGRLDETERLALTAVLLAIDNDDSVAATDGLLTLLGTPEGFERREFERRFGRLIVRHRGGFGGGSAALFGDMARLITGAGFAVPGQVAGVFRTLAAVEGTLLQLDPDFDLMTAARRSGGGVLTHLADPERLLGRAAGQLLTALPVLQRLPSRLDKLTGDLATGRFSVGVRLLEHPGDRAFRESLAHQVITTLIAIACLLGAVILIVHRAGPEIVHNVPVTTALGGFLGLAGGVLALRGLVRGR